MVERRSPSPENRKPILEWEVKAIPDAVEKWYAEDAPEPLSPPVPEQEEIADSEQQSPITAEEVSALSESAARAIHGGATETEQDYRLKETLCALRAEDRILKFYVGTYPDYAVDAAEQLRADPLGFGLINDSVRLHPNDAEGLSAKREVFSFHDKLVHYVGEAMKEGKEFTRDDLLAMYERQQHREGEFKEHSDKYEAYAIKNGFGSYDFDLENLHAASERHVLATHLYLSMGENKTLEAVQPAQIAAHELIESVLPKPVPVTVPTE